MIKHKSPIKRAKQDEKRHQRNHSYKSRVATATRKTISLADSGDKEQAGTEFKRAQALIDRAASKGILHRNTVARKISRIARRVARMDG